jgi:purine-nucleoside phosphorylase
MNKSLKDKIDETCGFLKNKVKTQPQVAIILGTGLGSLVQEIQVSEKISYQEVPNFLTSTVETHQSQLVFGRLAGKEVVAMQGRFHYYEGYSLSEITFPVYVMKFVGAETLIVSNAAGGLNPQFELGDLMLISDHINLMGNNPLIGPNDERIGPRFPDMFNTYHRPYLSLMEKVALEEKIKVQKGVYVAVSGPNLETAAEYRFLRGIGADAVGMSTVPEVIVARHCGLKVLGISCITDLCFPDNLKPADIQEIIKIASQSEPKMTYLIRKFIEKINEVEGKNVTL